MPNALTAFRIVLVPLFAWMLLAHPDEPGWRVLTAGVFSLAILTDSLDGYLARKNNLVTRFGKLADPIADKALTGTALICLSVIGELWWWVTIVILVREWGITVMRFAMLRYGVMAAGRGGKIKTVFQAVAIILYLLPLAAVASWAPVAGDDRDDGWPWCSRWSAAWTTCARRSGSGDRAHQPGELAAGHPGAHRAPAAGRDRRDRRVAHRGSARSAADRRAGGVRQLSRRSDQLRHPAEGHPCRRQPGHARTVGPVAERTAAEMASGVCRRCQADWGLATTGVAGPEPQDGHPVGEVYVAVAHPASGLLRVKALSLTGDRATIRSEAAAHAVWLLADALGIAAEAGHRDPEEP